MFSKTSEKTVSWSVLTTLLLGNFGKERFMTRKIEAAQPAYDDISWDAVMTVAKQVRITNR